MKKITIQRGGPYLVTGGVPLARELIVCDQSGMPDRWERGKEYAVGETYSLCRCGSSGDMPFCDGSHAKVGFEGIETASRQPFFECADVIEGPGIDLYDVASLCAGGKFCHRGGNVWTMAATASDPDTVALAISDACDCPSGRLVARDKATGELIEPGLKPSISVIEMPAAGLSGPLWVKGGIPIESANGERYEVRNRVTLCRCGRTRNMPFCDGTHAMIGFNDGDETVR